MKSKIFIFVLVFAASILLIGVIFPGISKKEPVTITQSSDFEFLTIDEKIKRAEIIVVGEVKSTLPSHWLAPEGKDLTKASPEEVF